jgi:carboxypeptidase family protein
VGGSAAIADNVAGPRSVLPAMRRVPPAVALAGLLVSAPGTRASDGGVVEGVVRGGAARVEVRRAGGVGTDRVPGRFRVHDPTDIAPWATAAVAATATAHADGAFRIEGLAPGVYWVTAVRDDGAQASGVVGVGVGESGARADLSLPSRGVTITGRAVHADGAPFRGWVEATWQGVRTAWTPTGEDGSFRFGGVVGETASLVAVRPGEMCTSGSPIALPAAAPVVFTVDAAGGHELHGRVVAADGGAGVPNATVYFAQAAPGLFGYTAVRADADGRWRGKAWSDCRIFGVAPGFRWGEGHCPADDRRADWTGDATIPLGRTAAVTGRVTRADGAPAAGVLVHARAKFWPNSPWDEVETTTAADGTYRLTEVDPTGANVFAFGGGFATVGLADDLGNAVDVLHPRLGVELKPGATATHDIVVEPAGGAVVRVVDEKGAPVAGALVSAAWQPTTGDNFGFMAPPRGLPAASDADGRVVVADLVPRAAYTFEADAEGRARGTAAPAKVKAGEEAVIEIRLGAAR